MFDLWVNPGLDLNPPDATSFGDTAMSMFDMLEIRQVFLENNEYVWFDELQLGLAFSDVISIPEPGTMCMLGLAVAGLRGYVRRRRRS